MSTLGLVSAAPGRCPGCGSGLADGLLSCPGCQRLVHADRLKTLAAEAAAAAEAGDLPAALGAWRESLLLLPPTSRQHAWVSSQIAPLSERVDVTPPPMPTSGRWKWLAALGPVALLLWKFKFLVVAALSKGKLLLLGLTKAGTLLSMFAMVGVYWTVWGFWFALGVVLSIYVHEMGHVAALRRYGIPASAPMFIPGFGALVRLRQSPANARENSRVGLAGPLWGLGAAIVALLAAQLTGGGLWGAIARTGAWINLFNLMPIWQLDGSRAFAALTRSQRWIAVLALAGAWWLSADGVVLLVLIVAVATTATTTAAAQADRGALALFAAIALGLAAVFRFSAGLGL